MSKVVDAGIKYWVEIIGAKNNKMDVYSVCDSFELNSACSHAIKKVLMAGRRGQKGELQDIQEAITALQRHEEIIKSKLKIKDV